MMDWCFPPLVFVAPTLETSLGYKMNQIHSSNVGVELPQDGIAYLKNVHLIFIS